MSIDELNKGIDTVLNMYKSNPVLNNLSLVKVKNSQEVIKRMYELGLVKKFIELGSSELKHEITTFGYEVLSYGGWALYLKDKQEGQKLSIKVNRMTSNNYIVQYVFLSITVIATCFTAVISYYDLIIHREEVELQRKAQTRPYTQTKTDSTTIKDTPFSIPKTGKSNKFKP